MDANALPAEVLGKAVLRAAEGLEVSVAGLGQLMSAQDAAHPQAALTIGSIASSRALALLEVFRRASVLVGNDPQQLRLWAGSMNQALGAAPCQLLTWPEGLQVVLDYVRGVQTP